MLERNAGMLARGSSQVFAGLPHPPGPIFSRDICRATVKNIWSTAPCSAQVNPPNRFAHRTRYACGQSNPVYRLLARRESKAPPFVTAIPAIVRYELGIRRSTTLCEPICQVAHALVPILGAALQKPEFVDRHHHIVECGRQFPEGSIGRPKVGKLLLARNSNNRSDYDEPRALCRF